MPTTARPRAAAEFTVLSRWVYSTPAHGMNSRTARTLLALIMSIVLSTSACIIPNVSESAIATVVGEVSMFAAEMAMT